MPLYNDCAFGNDCRVLSCFHSEPSIPLTTIDPANLQLRTKRPFHQPKIIIRHYRAKLGERIPRASLCQPQQTATDQAETSSGPTTRKRCTQTQNQGQDPRTRGKKTWKSQQARQSSTQRTTTTHDLVFPGRTTPRRATPSASRRNQSSNAGHR